MGLRIGAMLAAACAAALSLITASGESQEPASPAPPVTIGVFGDSLADGLWVGLRWQLRGDNRVADVVQLSEVSTGFANWTYRDIAAKTEEQLGLGRYDIAVVMFGSNDMQGIRDGTGSVHRFRSAGWEAVYRERVRIVLDLLHDHGAQVIWVGLPVMRSAGYDANVRHLNAIFEEEAEAAGAVYVSTREVSAGPDGGYSGYLEDASGTPRLMRADDGIHFTLPGYRRIAAPVAAVIDAALADPELGRPRPAEPETPAFESLVQLYIRGEPYVCLPASEAQIDAALSPEARRSRN
ncbi:DUF459 domain-containing protein [Marinicauda algicola]|uniref:DUF459 domain-containing protein n=1 Tax=Marinicauda algicola TaxID=2029849 RepID=A0A4S2GWY8_9PROT|nr:DUF459 domain-containing protein [Marinicauda algicola]TGY87554.1 DUF459 domain-containing protein [Marinicauda algicola]